MTLSTRDKGRYGEEIAEAYLTEKGYRVVCRNWTCRYGEIDLVARQGDRLHFVEIRRRIGAGYGPALESISPAKIRRVRRAAEAFLFKNADLAKLAPFFSVVAIDERESGERRIEFLPDAFG